MEKENYKILYRSGMTYNLPLYLLSTVDEMGVMVGFDGEIEQVEQMVNFTYNQTGKTITVTNSANPLLLRKLIEQNFTIDFGDGESEMLPVNQTIQHTYTYNGTYTVSITLDSPWEIKKLTKLITVPEDLSMENPLGTFTGVTIPAYGNLTGQTQDYLNDLDYTNTTGFTTFTYMAFGQSKIDQTFNYGSNIFTGETGMDENGLYSGYTIDGFYYRDYEDGYTMITGSTEAYAIEDVFNTLITRNEHFIGFVDEPIIYSDIFIERGKLGVMEQNFRLTEVDNIGELETYGNGFFNIKKQ
jgi:hypothetical protein